MLILCTATCEGPWLPRVRPGVWKDSALRSPSLSLPWSHVLDKSEAQIASWSLESHFRSDTELVSLRLMGLQEGPGTPSARGPTQPPPAHFLRTSARLSGHKRWSGFGACVLQGQSGEFSISNASLQPFLLFFSTRLEDINNKCCLVDTLKHSLHDGIPPWKPSSTASSCPAHRGQPYSSARPLTVRPPRLSPLAQPSLLLLPTQPVWPFLKQSPNVTLLQLCRMSWSAVLSKMNSIFKDTQVSLLCRTEPSS